MRTDCSIARIRLIESGLTGASDFILRLCVLLHRTDSLMIVMWQLGREVGNSRCRHDYSVVAEQFSGEISDYNYF